MNGVQISAWIHPNSAVREGIVQYTYGIDLHSGSPFTYSIGWFCVRCHPREWSA